MAFDTAVGRRLITRRALVTIVPLVLLGALAGAAVAVVRPPDATAAATILLNPLDGNPFSTSTRGDNLANLETEAQLVTSHDVVERVTSSTHSTLGAEALVSAVEVRVPSNTQLMEIEAHDRSPAVASQLAQAFADDFLSSRGDRARRQAQEQIASLQDEITERRKAIAALEAQLADAPTGNAPAISSQIDSTQAQIVSLESRIAQLRTAPSDPGQIVTPATLQPSPLWRRWWGLALLGALAGLALGATVVLLRGHPFALRGTRMRVLGTLGADDLRATPGQPTAPARDLALAVLTAQRRRPLTLLLSSEESEGPVSTAALAVAIAATGNTTVVVDTTGAEGVGEAGPDLAALLSTRPPPLGVPDSLTWIAPGDLLAHSQDLLLSPRMASLLRDLAARADVVLIASGGLGTYASRAIVDLVDAIVTESSGGASPADPAVAVDGLGTVLVPPPETR